MSSRLRFLSRSIDAGKGKCDDVICRRKFIIADFRCCIPAVIIHT